MKTDSKSSAAGKNVASAGSEKPGSGKAKTVKAPEPISMEKVRKQLSAGSILKERSRRLKDGEIVHEFQIVEPRVRKTPVGKQFQAETPSMRFWRNIFGGLLALLVIAVGVSIWIDVGVRDQVGSVSVKLDTLPVAVAAQMKVDVYPALITLATEVKNLGESVKTFEGKLGAAQQDDKQALTDKLCDILRDKGLLQKSYTPSHAVTPPPPKSKAEVVPEPASATPAPSSVGIGKCEQDYQQNDLADHYRATKIAGERYVDHYLYPGGDLDLSPTLNRRQIAKEQVVVDVSELKNGVYAVDVLVESGRFWFFKKERIVPLSEILLFNPATNKPEIDPTKFKATDRFWFFPREGEEGRLLVAVR